MKCPKSGAQEKNPSGSSSSSRRNPITLVNCKMIGSRMDSRVNSDSNNKFPNFFVDHCMNFCADRNYLVKRIKINPKIPNERREKLTPSVNWKWTSSL